LVKSNYVSLRVDDATLALVRRYAGRWQCSQSEAIRRLLVAAGGGGSGKDASQPSQNNPSQPSGEDFTWGS